MANDFSALSALTDISADLSSAGTVTSGGTGTVDGQSVVILKAADGTTVDIAGAGTAYPVQVRTDTAVHQLSDWNGVGTFTPPPNPIVIPSTS